MRKKSRVYSIDFKRKAVELSYARDSITEVSKELGVSKSALSRWRQELKQYGKNSFPGRGHAKLTDDQKEISRLKKQLKDLELERDILKKAISIFSVSDKKNSGL
jgi:transposase